VRIIVLNGTPRRFKCYMQSVALSEGIPQHGLEIIQSCARIKESSRMVGLPGKLWRKCGSRWTYGLFHSMFFSWLPSTRGFIELIFERKAEGCFQGKYAAPFQHRFISSIIRLTNMCIRSVRSGNEICRILLRGYVRSPERRRAEATEALHRDFLEAIERKVPTSKTYLSLLYPKLAYRPGNAQKRVMPAGKKIVILTDSTDQQSNLGKMIARFKDSFSSESKSSISMGLISRAAVWGAFIAAMTTPADTVTGLSRFMIRN